MVSAKFASYILSRKFQIFLAKVDVPINQCSCYCYWIRYHARAYNYFPYSY